MVSWSFIVAHTPGGQKIPDKVQASDGTTVDISENIIAPSSLPAKVVTTQDDPLENMGSSWCARSPYSVEFIKDVAPDESPWIVPFWAYDNVTVKVAELKGLTLCVRPSWFFVNKHYNDVYQSTHVPCVVPCEISGSTGSVPVIPSIPLLNERCEQLDVDNDLKPAIDKAMSAGYEPVFIVYMNVYNEGHLTVTADTIKAITNIAGEPATLKECEKIVKKSDRIQLNAISSLHWEALRLHDLFYDFVDKTLNETARTHGLAVSLRAIASLTLATKAEPPVPKTMHYSILYDTDLPLPSMIYDEQSLSATLRALVRIGEQNADRYHNIVRDLETGIRGVIAPFPT